MFCLSIRIEPGEADQFGLPYTLTFTSANFASPNHEAFPIFEDDVTHATFFSLEAPDFPEPLMGDFVFTAPEELDDNGNGIPDFYEVEMAMAGARTMGFWNSEVAGGEAAVTWQRAAGQHRGTFLVQFTSDEFGTLPEFTHPFEIIEYGGTFAYEPTDGPVDGTADLRRVGVDASHLLGPMVLTREPTNRLNQFFIGESTLTNEMGELVPVSLGDLERDPDYVMDYFGAIALLNGDPATPEVDYELFFIGFDDPNDADEDGVPDLTDDVGPLPEPPLLALAPDGDGFRLTITGSPGVTYTLQRASVLLPEAWLDDRQVSLETTNLVLTVPAGGGSERYWRLRWP
jgi:hypothetical protein